MELEDLENINKNDFLPLLPLNIKQELLDNNVGAGGVDGSAGDVAAVGGGVDGMEVEGDSCGGGGSVEATGNLCDSVQKQVDETTTATGELSPAKCIWCAHLLTAADAPKLLECLHVACGQCITARFSEIDRTQPPLVHCPRCNMASQLDHIIDNQFLIEQNHHSADNCGDPNSGGADGSCADANLIKCSSCSDDASATSWCVECSEFICDSCVQAHQRLKITKDHTIKTKEEAAADQQTGGGPIADKSLLCHAHPAEKLSLFCETCDKLTCRDCQLVDHRDHKYKFAHEIAAETRTLLGGLLGEITYKRVLLNSAMKVIDDRQALIADKKKELVKEITSMVVKITNTVNMRGKQLVLRLNEVCDSKLKVLNEKKDALQMLSGHTDHCIDFVQTALDKGSDNAVLFSKKTLSRHLQKVKCQRADIPNPEIPVRIQVQLNQVQELQKVIAQVGTIIVDGKAYPPSQSPGLPRQQPSPNMIVAGSGVSGAVGGGGIGGPSMRCGPSAVGSGGAGGVLSGMVQQQQQQQQVQPPNSPMQQQMLAAQQQQAPPHYGSPPVYNTASPQQQQQQQQQFNMQQQMNRPQFGPDQGGNAFVRFPNMGPHLRGQVAPHVSSSTHPQNMGPGGPGGGNPTSHMAGVFGNGPAGPFGLQGPTAAAVAAAAAAAQQQQQHHQLQQQQLQHLQQQQQQQQQAMGTVGSAVMRSFGGPGPQGGGGGGGVYGASGGPSVGPQQQQQQQGGNGVGGFIPNNGPRYQNFQHGRMGGGGGGGVGGGAANVQGQPLSMRPMMQNNDMRFAGQQSQVFGPGHPSNHTPHNHSGGQNTAMLAQHQHQQQQQQQQQHHHQQQQHQQHAAAAVAVAQQMIQQQNVLAKPAWHIPQSVQQNNGMARPSSQSPLMQFGMRQNENSFKISLKSPNTLKSNGNGTHSSNGSSGATGAIAALNTPGSGLSGSCGSSSSGGGGPMGVAPNVTSTNPKTPSPSTNDNTKEFSDSIDKACEESVNDLMATIAKLDSNGVQVLPEGRGKTTSPQVHSSTDLSIVSTGGAEADKTDQKDDPNEDWCAVCLDGGELMCCDKCPKVFHQNCHIPNISSLPDESETWQCLLCVNLAELRTEPCGEKRSLSLSPNELKITQRICLELICQYEQSLPFRELEPLTNTSYYEIIHTPMSFDIVRTRLDMGSANHYTDVMSFVNDVRQLFKNVYLYYREDSKVFGHARYLDQFFEQQLRKWLPSYTIGRTVASDLAGNGNGGDSAAAAAAAVTAMRSDTPTFGDGSVVIGVKRMRTAEANEPLML